MNQMGPEEQIINESDELDHHRRESVKQAFLHAWKGYKDYAWGKDELAPISLKPSNRWGDIGAIIIDSMDTMIIMDLKDEVEEAREFISRVAFNKDKDVSTFETIIRFVGGLLSCYSLTNDGMYLEKATELADRLLPAFRSKSGVPYSTVNLITGKAFSPDWCYSCSFLSEFGSVQLELNYLSFISGNRIYEDIVNKLNNVFLNDKKYKGLFPTQYNVDNSRFDGDHFTFGSRGDSFYEYLIKQVAQNENRHKLKKLYDNAMKEMIDKLIKKSKNNLTYIIELQYDYKINKMDHLTCFIPGMLALDGDQEHLELAKEIIYTCYQFYNRSKTGLAPEIAGFDTENDDDFYFQAPFNHMRPGRLISIQ
jgi:mannosyl-oligosaccharide alpha-1,2-mannosidase